MAEEKLYFIALIPPEPVAKEVTRIKQDFADHYKSRRALNSPPHITLIPPFRWNENEEMSLHDSLSNFTWRGDFFTIALDGFNSFPPRVIFIRIVENEELDLLEQELRTYCERIGGFPEKTSNREYHPHMTVAFKDLRRAEFHRAWEVYNQKDFVESFEADSFYLLKHNGRKWEINRQFAL